MVRGSATLLGSIIELFCRLNKSAGEAASILRSLVSKLASLIPSTNTSLPPTPLVPHTTADQGISDNTCSSSRSQDARPFSRKMSEPKMAADSSQEEEADEIIEVFNSQEAPAADRLPADVLPLSSSLSQV